MKIEFTFEVNGFSEASEVEEVLKKHSIKYSAKVIENGASGRRGKRINKCVNVEQARAIVKMAKAHPNWTNEQIGDTQRIGAEVARKIVHGIHPICSKL